MKIAIHRIAALILMMSTFILIPNLVTAQSWTVSPNNSLYSNSRISVGGSTAVPSDGRMHVLTTTDRFGMYIENSSPKSYGFGLPSYSLCLDDGGSQEGTRFGIYVKVPEGTTNHDAYAGYFDGNLGTCGQLRLNNTSFPNSNTSHRWSIYPDHDFNDLRFTGGSGSVKFVRSPTAEKGKMVSIVGKDNAALSVHTDDSAPSTFYVKGKGEAISKYGLTVYNGQTSHPIKMYGDPANGAPELFYVRSDGAIYSRSALTIAANDAAAVPKPFLMLGPDGQEICNIDNSGTIKAQGSLRIYSPQGNTDDAIVVEGLGGQSSYEKKFKVTKDGKVWSREVRVTQLDIPDYVFKDGYDLMPLSEIEKYVTKHKHLPNIPSEKEILKDGLNLGDQQMLQLEKIEELTLHLIAMNKRLEKLEKENEELKEKFKSK